MEKRNNYPNELSGGEIQRVGLASALVKDPAVLLLDEPTGDLDSQIGSQVFDELLKLRREHNTTLIVAIHDISLIQNEDRVVFLSNGQILEDFIFADDYEKLQTLYDYE